MNSLSPIGQEISSFFLGSRDPALTIVTWQDKCQNFPFLFFLPVFISGHNDIGYGISLWSVGICCLQMCLPAIFCPIPALLSLGKRGENLDAVKALFSKTQNTNMLPTLLQSQIQRTAPHRLL